MGVGAPRCGRSAGTWGLGRGGTSSTEQDARRRGDAESIGKRRCRSKGRRRRVDTASIRQKMHVSGGEARQDEEEWRLKKTSSRQGDL
jgi:hypothetical protein